MAAMMRGSVVKTALTSAEGEGIISERGAMEKSYNASRSFTYLRGKRRERERERE